MEPKVNICHTHKKMRRLPGVEQIGKHRGSLFVFSAVKTCTRYNFTLNFIILSSNMHELTLIVFFLSSHCPSPISANSTNIAMNPANSQQLIDYNDTHVLDFQPSLKTLCIYTVVQNSLNLSELPQDIIYEIRMMQQANSISRPLTNTG